MTSGPNLTSDCAKCAALCCVALAFNKGKMFAANKDAGQPCPHLDGHLCSIHDSLEDRGYKGCVIYDCAGAGQRVIQDRFNEESWRDSPELLPAMIRDFANLRPIHERMTLLKAAEAYNLPTALETRRVQMLKQLEGCFRDTSALKAAFDAFLDDLRNFVKT